MRRVVTEFLQDARAAGLPISVAESIDALRAAAAVGVEREEFREALAAAVVKDESDRPAFDEVFDRFFSAGAEAGRRRRKRAASGEEGGSGPSGGEGEGAAAANRDLVVGPGNPARKFGGLPAAGSVAPPPNISPYSSSSRLASDDDPRRLFTQDFRVRPLAPAKPAARSITQSKKEKPAASSRQTESRGQEMQKRFRRRELLRKPFREMDPIEAEELAALAADLSRRFRGKLRRRFRVGGRERLDFRRTLRRSISRGGAAFDLVFRRRRPGRPDLLVLCDVSGSVKIATDFFVSVLSPCESYFRTVRIFVFVDRPVEASFENGRLVPHGPVDFHAFSDFGRVLTEIHDVLSPALGRSTVVVILGDARNNRRPARVDLLKQLRSRVRAIWWLNSDQKERWGTGDSAIEAYRPVCDELLECANGAELLAALARITR